MARRKKTAEPPADEVDEDALEWRLWWLARSLFPAAVEDGTPERAKREQLYAALGTYRRRLERRGVPLDRQVAEVETWLAERGRLDGALRLVEHLERARERWART